MTFMICLSVFTLVGGVTTVKAAEDDIAFGTFGTCSWVIDADGVLTISPTNGIDGTLGQCDRLYFYLQCPWFDYRTQVTQVMIDNGVHANQNSDGLFAFLEKFV